MKILLSCFAFAIVLFSCAEETTPIDVDAIKKEVRAQWDAFEVAWENEDARTCGTFYTAGSMNVPPQSKTLVGREEIADFYQFLFDSNLSSDYNHRMLDFEVYGNGKNALEYGYFSVDWTRNDSTTWQYSARSMTHWERGNDEKWYIKRFIFNNPPESASD